MSHIPLKFQYQRKTIVSFTRAYCTRQIFVFQRRRFLFLVLQGQNQPSAVLKDEHFCLSKTVFEIKHVEPRRPSLKDKNLRLWVPQMADFYVLERSDTKIFVFERQKSAVCGGL